jgi:hypothetical protein
MKGSAAAQATQSSRVKPRPVIEKAPKLLQLRLILVDPDALANVRFGVIRDEGGPPASPVTPAMPPKAEVNSERRRN